MTDHNDAGLPPELQPFATRIRRIGARVLRDAQRLERLESETLTAEELVCIIEGLTDLKLRFIQGPGRRDWEVHDRVVARLRGIRDRRD